MMTSSELVRRVKKLEEMLAPAREAISVSVEYRAIDGYGRVVERFAPSIEVEPDVVLRIAPHFTS